MLGICSLSVIIVLHETLLVTVLMYGSETMFQKEKEKRDLELELCRWTISENC